ncbi:GSCOCG00002262001-RA-CDS [Cotesia congregata]|nr:GSCOCG00002262001-RA-CDS [Cotesia congregata]
MSELTQMCRERVNNKKPPNFQLKSTEIKGNFDPLDELTRELHEMNLQKSEGNDDELEDITEHSNISEASDLSDTSLAFRYPKVEKSTFTFCTGEVLPQSKPLKSPKSPKIDEYNEANILNDCSPDDKFDNRSLSLDKQSHYLKSATITTTTTANNDTSHSSPDNDHESSGYSNFKIRHTGKVKMRPKAKVKSDIGETRGELKLTPSLEKLASEIQFLPAKKTNIVNHHTSNHNHNHSHSDSHSHNHNHNSNNKIYKNTFKTKREGRYFHRHEFTDDDDDDEEDDDDNDDDDDDEDDDGIISAARKCNLKKSSTLHCATIPENYRRFRISNNFAAILARSKRRSRSLSDLNSFEDEEDIMEENVTYPQNSPKIKPVPLPRTKIPAIKSEDELSTRLEDKREEMGTVAPLPRKTITKKDYPEVWVNSKQVSGYRGQTPEVDIESSTAVGFKSLLCTSDSGSDNCLQSKELVNNDSNERHDSCNYSSNFKNRGLEKSSSGANLRKDGVKVRESPLDEQILSSNASSEALQSHTRVAPECYECAIDLPPGWTQKYDPHTDQICFINEQGDKWFSSNDDEGKIYFFEENSNESSWVLPTVTPGLSDWPQLSFDGNMKILKEGSISRTKITENGKKLRKNWSTSYAVLTELFLLFFKDSKTFNTMMKSGQSPIAKPDISVDLNGAIIEPGERASSRKNVYMISTVLGLQVLIQSDNTALAAEWFQEIHGAIRKLPFSFKSQAKPFAGPPEVRKISNSKLSTDQSEESKKSSKVARSRSMKTGFGDAVKRLDDSLEDLSGTVAERQTKIKAKLRRFFQRRPPVESLVKNGIYKNEPAFGSYLKDVCPTEHPRVPLFVKTCIEVLESNEENMKTDGLYRASGNLSQIQKIRLQVDQYNLNVLSQEEDVHVLTGALKLFFRELKEPLIPSSFFKEALNASMLKKASAKIQCFRDIVKALPPANYDTLQFLLKHLLKVTSYQEFNRMHIPNLAIVFGPTLMWPAEESANMALDLMQQNLVIECLLSEYNKIFK